MLNDKIKGSGSFFRDILRNFILLLLAPMITILLIFSQADRTVKSQVLESASKTFTLYYEQMDEIMVGMRNTCTTIYANEKCQLYSRESVGNSGMADSLNYDIYQILQNLSEVAYHDIFIYYYRNNKIISGIHTSLTAEQYYDSYYGKLGEEGYREEFLEVIKSDSKRPTCHIIKNIDGKAYLCMTLGVRSQRLPKSNYTICVVLKPEYIEQMHIMRDVNENSIFMIYNEEDRQVLLNNSKFDDIDAEEYILSEEVEYDTWVDRNEYMIQVKETDKPTNKYAYIVLYDCFWDVLQNLRFYCILGISICVMVSVVFAYRSTLKTYSPIGNIIEYIQRANETRFDKKKESEFLYIRSFMENNEKRLRESKKNSLEWCLNKLLEGKINDSETDLLEKNGISFPFQKFFVCILQLEMVGVEIENDLTCFIIHNVIEELGNNIGKAYFVELTKTRYALITNTEEEVDALNHILNEGQNFLKQYYQIVLTIGCSNEHGSVAEISEAYKEAQEAVRYRFLMGLGRQIYYSDVHERGLQRQNSGESKIFMLMIDYVREESENCDVDSFVERLMYIYEVNEEISMDVADFFRNEVINTLSRVMELNHYSEETRNQVVKELQATDTLADFQQRLCHHITDLCKHKSNKKSKEDICVKAKGYIDENYSDTQLSVAMLGKEMGMQAAHLSKLFREAYGVSIMDYVASVRIFHAKRMLREEQLSVQVVAEKAGFISSHAFIRVFKMQEGITPGKYKELCEREAEE